MSKYCKLAGQLTNCTDNCRECLEEENAREIEVGDRVRYITEDTDDAKESGYYPPKGTIGVVIGIDLADDIAPYHIKWPAGTTKWDGCWYVDIGDIELAEKFE